MAVEIERKFLLKDDRWRSSCDRSQRLRQGYIVNTENLSVRIRLSGDKALLTIKGASEGSSRPEFEYPIPPDDANTMLDSLVDSPLIEKTRYWVRYGDHIWEIDVFAGDNTGLIIAEIELTATDENFARPPWLGEEVTGDARYFNAALVNKPFSQWS